MSLQSCLSLPLQIGVALYLLYTQVRFAFVSGIAITVLLIPVNKWISTLIARATEKMMKQKDERIRSAGELIKYIRTLKMYSWEHLFSNRLLEKRSLEVDHLSTRKYLDAWCVFFWATTPALFSLFTFGLFSLMGHPLNAATVFTCVALFNTLISPLNSFPWVINGLIDAIISARRLSNFLSCPEFKFQMECASIEQLHESDPLSMSNFEGRTDTNPRQIDVVFKDATCGWSSSYEESQNIVLDCISLGMPKGYLIAVIGEVGSGKSSLLNSILGEMHLLHGSIDCCGTIAYVPQVPWIMSGSVRDNILFGEKFHARRYSEVLHVCALDIDVSLMVGGDLAYTGEKGVNLSGGQRARLALARAIYHSSDIYFLDDVLSAVDAQVSCWILDKAIMGPLMNQRTRVLCTHNSQCLPAEPTQRALQVRSGGREQLRTSAKRASKGFIGLVVSAPSGEKRLNGHLGWSRAICKTLILFLGIFTKINLAIFAADLVVVMEKGCIKWSGNLTSFLLTPYASTSLVENKNLMPSQQLEQTGSTGAMDSIFPMERDYETTSVEMQDTTDKEYRKEGRVEPVVYKNYAMFCGWPVVALICVSAALMQASRNGNDLWLSYWVDMTSDTYSTRFYLFYYRSTSRELRRLDSVSRSPIYASFTETIDGSSTIRAFRKEELFMARFMQHVALYQQTSYSELTASLWLSLRLQLLAAVIIFYVALTAIIGCRNDLPVSFGTPGLVGLALSYAAPIVSLLSSFLTSFTETEKEMVSVERVIQYMDIPQEELAGSQAPDPDWPIQGCIEFEHVILRYRPTSPAALNDVSFKIRAGTQVGIVGRTGAGKSSIINALFRLSPICHGRILVDDIDIAHILIGDLRSRFAVVPQSPFLFEGSLRENLDPFGLISDSKIWETLEKCHVKEDIAAAGGLDIRVKEAGTSFSVGQRQLICLARALLRSSKILCLDECTANIDTRTASIIQKTISSECRGMTVLTIAHRISVVLDMDNILVLDRGILVERGNPQVLMKDDYSQFSGFARASTM
ncbi:hypothetical protein Taro_039864 [Colocasia esculenta]|uniref:ABC transporter C family member 13 n=1 Tax=Colocasia esculenta TaxID=4460 RepID=A0A843WRD9_COLES|nr:hypothetical protein [Colocasia esculenta]